MKLPFRAAHALTANGARVGHVQAGGTVAGLQRADLIATVTRADGRVEQLGVVAASDFTLRGRLRSLFSRMGGARR